MYDKAVERGVLETIHELQMARQRAERRLEADRQEFEEAGRGIASAEDFLKAYRRLNDQPVQVDPIPVPNQEYTRMGPVDLVEHWATLHDGEVVVKDLTKAALAAGVFTHYRNGSASIYSVLKRKKYERIGQGHFRKAEPSMNGQLPID